jgi:1-acyl-sn-glycerol-3-phosphate acyltransferase
LLAERSRRDRSGTGLTEAPVWVLALIQHLTALFATVFFAGLIVLLSTLGIQRWVYPMVRSWCRTVQTSALLRHRIRGRENIPDGPFMIIANHSSHLDGPALIVTMGIDIHFVIKKELAEVPLWGAAAMRAGFIAIDRSRSAEAQRTMAEAIESISRGRHVLVFPEGTRSPDHRLQPFKKGGFHLAIEAQVPILPVAINGSHALFPKGAMYARPGTVEVVVCQPIPTHGVTRDELPALMQRVRDAIREGRRLDPDFIDEA